MRALLLSTAITALAVPAVAGSLSEPIVEPVLDAPQVYVAPGVDWTGAYAGVQLGYGDLNASGAATDEGSGVIGGLTAGYDYDFGTFVLGAGVDYDFADIDLDSGAGQLDSVARLKARAGFEAGQALIYGTGGAAFADAQIGGTDFSDTGYFLGAGVEYMVNQTFSIGGEVLYHQFDDFDNTGIDIDATTVQVRAVYRF